MADRARDLTLNLVTDESKFDTQDSARQIDDAGDAAQRAAGQLDDLETAASGAGTALEDAAKDASGELDDLQRALRDVEDAAERAAREGASLNQIGDAAEDGTTRAKAAVGDLRDEATGTAAEVAAGFDGSFGSIADGGQELATNLLSSLGPVGAGIGVAAGLAVGLFRAQAEKLKESVSELTTSLIQDGGRLSRDSVVGKLEDFAADGTILDLARQAREAKVPVQDYLLAVAGDPAAIDRTTRALNDQRDASNTTLRDVRANGDAQLELGENVRRAAGAVEDAAEINELASSSYDQYAAAADRGRAAVFRYAEGQAATQAVNDDAAAGLAAVSAAAGQMADDVELSADSILESLQRAAQAQVDYATNQDSLYNELGQEALDFLSSQGENAAQVAQILVDAPADRRTEIIDAYRVTAQQSTAGYAAGITDGLPGVERAAGQVGTQSVRALESAGARAAGAAQGAAFAAGLSSASTNAADAADRIRAAYQQRLEQTITVNPRINIANSPVELRGTRVYP